MGMVLLQAARKFFIFILPPFEYFLQSFPFRILDGWTVIDRLTAIKSKTLVINSRWDISQDFVIQPLVDKIPNVKWIKFNNSSHMPFWEERSKYFRTVGEFLSN